MRKIDKNIFREYYDDLYDLISHFTETTNRTDEVMKNLEYFIDNQSAMVAGHLLDNRLASFIWCYEKTFGGKKRIHISYFIVGENFRGKGLSRDLLLYAKRKAHEIGIEEIDLNVEPNNHRAIGIYHKSGFTTEKIQLVMKIDKDYL